jgi:hypothetical protein
MPTVYTVVLPEGEFPLPSSDVPTYERVEKFIARVRKRHARMKPCPKPTPKVGAPSNPSKS